MFHSLTQKYDSYSFYNSDPVSFIAKINNIIGEIRKIEPYWSGVSIPRVEETLKMHKGCLISGEGGILYKAIVDYPPIFSELKNGGYEAVDISEGDILKIRPDGLIEKSTFEYNTYYGRDWWYYGSYSLLSTENDVKGYTKNDYIEDLKSVACYLGYSPDDIDLLISEGFSLEEVEDYLYCGCEI